MKLFLLVIGMVLVVEALPWAANPEAMRRRVLQLAELPPQLLRNLALLILALGLLLVAVVQRGG